MNHTTIDPKTLSDVHAREQSGAQIVDVRTPAEFEAAHIAGSKLAPLDALDPDHVKTAFDANEPVYVVCRSGNRAKQAIEKLRPLAAKMRCWSMAESPLGSSTIFR